MATPTASHWQRFIDAWSLRHPGWDGQSTQSWSVEDRATAVRALARDMFENAGENWWRASEEADAQITHYYADWAKQTQMNTPWTIRLGSDQDFEFFSLHVRPSSGATSQPGLRSSVQRSIALARTAPVVDAWLPDAGLEEAVQEFQAMLGSPNRLALIVIACALVRWKSLQEQQVVRGGAIWSGVRPAGFAHEDSALDVRLLYGRFGPAMEKALEADPEGGAFYLR